MRGAFSTSNRTRHLDEIYTPTRESVSFERSGSFVLAIRKSLFQTDRSRESICVIHIYTSIYIHIHIQVYICNLYIDICIYILVTIFATDSPFHGNYSRVKCRVRLCPAIERN